MSNALSVQVGGSHYVECRIQPVEYIAANDVGFLPGCVIKRMTRFNKKTGKGLVDLDKAQHEIELIKIFFKYRFKRTLKWVIQERAQQIKDNELIHQELVDDQKWDKFIYFCQSGRYL